VSRKSTLAEIALLPFIRAGAQDLDLGLVVSIWDARNRMALDAMIASDPRNPHASPDGLLRYVPNGQ
jgi:hypothetical protein